MPEQISWARLEPDSRDTTLRAGLEARVHDPLWLLARQLQLGELSADPGLGAAVTAELTAELAPMSAYYPGADGPRQAYAAAAAPLQALVEAEDVRSVPTARLRVQAGLQFLRLLAAHGGEAYADAYRARYSLAVPETVPDPASQRFLGVVGGRAPDGVRLYADLAAALRPSAGAGELPAEPAIEAADTGNVTAAAHAFLAWYDALFQLPAGGADAWHPARMEYAFAVDAAAPDAAIVLGASEYAGGELDWHDFSVRPGTPAPAGEAQTIGPLTLVPAPVAYPGMPARRFWEFEDAVVDFGGVEAEPQDIGRMLLTEFALVFGNDWLLLPLEVPFGSLVRVVSLDVRDSFGRSVRVPPTSTLEGSLGGWRVFTLSRDGPDGSASAGAYDDALLVPPVLAGRVQGPELEQVLLLRDELASLAWAVERRIEGANGAPYDRAETGTAATGAPPRTEAVGAYAYELAGTVPEYWLPLLPERAQPGDASIGLRLGSLERTLPDGSSQPILPLGRLLQTPADGNLVLPEEEVPREGARVSRAYRLARWVDGSSVLWLARRKGVGKGEGSSGLRYDGFA
jgi:hypothetical protein